VDDWLLRDATDADVPTLAGLIWAAFAEYDGRLDPPSGAHHETEDSLRARLATASAVLASVGGEPAGCVLYRREPAHVYLFRLAVLPSQRRRGLGRALIDHVEGRARELGLARVRLGVRLVLARQRAYYERLGYRPRSAECHPGYAEPTYLLLEKELPGPPPTS
jgi:ribosomal protein S18 acetylase RimI-like enzyme